MSWETLGQFGGKKQYDYCVKGRNKKELLKTTVLQSPT